MHQTTLRFSPDLWASLEAESGRLGVSVAQFVRDAAVTRLAFAHGFERRREVEQSAWQQLAASGPTLKPRIEAQMNGAEAVRAQARLARERAKRLRDEADRARARTVAVRTR